MVILVACEESQAVTIELRKLGHRAYSCDIEPCSGGYPGWHLQCDVLSILHEPWDMIIAFPPCTYMSAAGARWMYPNRRLNDERYAKAMDAKALFMKFYNHSCPKIAIENPRPLRCVGLPESSQTIQPYQFGHPYTKQTRLWLKGLPLLESTILVDPVAPYCPSWTGSGNKGHRGTARRGEDAKNRAKTFSGIAKAMAEQWAGDIRC